MRAISAALSEQQGQLDDLEGCLLGHAYPLNTLGGVLDAIVTEWAEMTAKPE